MKCDQLAKKLHIFTGGNPLKHERENSKSAIAFCFSLSLVIDKCECHLVTAKDKTHF